MSGLVCTPAVLIAVKALICTTQFSCFKMEPQFDKDLESYTNSKMHGIFIKHKKQNWEKCQKKNQNMKVFSNCDERS
jgi:hypothetical protein